MKNLTFLLLISMLCFNCSKDDDNDFASFSGITMTDVNGNLTGTIDNTDWIYDSTWTNGEKQLFDNFANWTEGYDTSLHIEVNPAYPNPISFNIVSISSTKQGDMFFHLRILDTKHKVYISTDTITDPQIIFDLTDIPLDQDSIARAYFTITRNDTCFYKGHGDLSLKKSN